jgi:hypothetical protein
MSFFSIWSGKVDSLGGLSMISQFDNKEKFRCPALFDDDAKGNGWNSLLHDQHHDILETADNEVPLHFDHNERACGG